MVPSTIPALEAGGGGGGGGGEEMKWLTASLGFLCKVETVKGIYQRLGRGVQG